jgi:hypothetical protein
MTSFCLPIVCIYFVLLTCLPIVLKNCSSASCRPAYFWYCAVLCTSRTANLSSGFLSSCLLVFLPTFMLVVLSYHRPVRLVMFTCRTHTCRSYYFCFMSYCLLVVLLNCRSAYLSFYLPVILSTCRTAYLLSCVPIVRPTYCHVFLPSCPPVVLSTSHRAYLSYCLPAVWSTCRSA